MDGDLFRAVSFMAGAGKRERELVGDGLLTNQAMSSPQCLG
jgi:hypothetical protein